MKQRTINRLILSMNRRRKKIKEQNSKISILQFFLVLFERLECELNKCNIVFSSLKRFLVKLNKRKQMQLKNLTNAT